MNFSYKIFPDSFQIVDSNNGNIEKGAQKTEDEKDEEKQVSYTMPSCLDNFIPYF